MIIAIKKNEGTIRCHYKFQETTTKATMVWTPPKNLPCSEWETAMISAAELFEKEALAYRKNSDYMVLDPADCDKTTPLQLYAKNVFMVKKEPFIAENTRDLWQRCLRLRINPRLGNLPIGDITPTQISDFLLGCQKEGLSVSTVTKYRTLLSLIFKMAKKDGYIKKNPMKKVDYLHPRKDEIVKNSVEAYTAEEIAYIEKCLLNEPLKWRTLVYLLDDTGIRIGECCALTWGEVDFQNKTITVTKSLGYNPEVGIYIGDPKNRKSRTISISSTVAGLLSAYYSQSEHHDATDFVFQQKNSTKPMFPKSPSHYLKKFAKRYNIQDLHPHKLRHSYASIAITNGADIASVSENLGHSNKVITLRTYTSANPESMKKASDIRRQAVLCAQNQHA